MSWLRDYVDVALPAEEIADKLTRAGNEVERITRLGASWDNIVVGHIVGVERVPRAERLLLTLVDVGDHTARIVTAATNIAAGQYVPVALPGSQLGHGAERVIIEPRTFSGVKSEGMLCSGWELGISDDADGIHIFHGTIRPGTPLRDVAADTVLEFAITPNRPDCLSMVGIAREIAALTGARLAMPEVAVRETGAPVEGDYSVAIDAPNLCARYVARLVRGVRVGPSPEWMAQRLRAAGLPVISNVVDVSNYVMWELGQPLHTFDARTLRGRRVVVRRARPGERITTIDQKDRELTGDMLVIADAARPVAIAGVMGGLDTEVSDATQDVLIESAHFHPESVRKTRLALGLSSEASRRFERGVDRQGAARAADRAAQLLIEVAGGAVAEGRLDAFPVPRDPVSMAFTSSDVSDLLGVEVPMDRVSEVLSSLQFSCSPVDERTLQVTVPSFRLDVAEPVDLVEEVARVIGYDAVPDAMPSGTVPAAGRNTWLEFQDDVRDALVGCGLTEIVTYALTNRACERRLLGPGGGRMGVGDPAPAGSGIRDAFAPTWAPLPSLRGEDLERAIATSLVLRNPLSSDLDTLRVTLLETTLTTIAANERHGAERARFFELGRIYLAQGDDLPVELPTLSLGLAGAQLLPSWDRRAVPDADFFEIKGIVELLLRRFNVGDVAFTRADHPTFHPGRAAYLICGRQVAGILGEAHPLVVERFGISQRRVCLAEIDLVALGQHARPGWVEPVPRFPAVVQDVAIVVDEDVDAATVVQVLRDAGGELVADVRLFDVYRGTQIPEGKKSLAYSLTFQSRERTLTTDEINAVRAALERALLERLGASLRR